MKSMHTRSSDHRAALLACCRCVCFCCESRYSVARIKHWIDGGQTAVCPCGVDAVLPDGDDARVSDATLAAMERYWFDLQRRIADRARVRYTDGRDLRPRLAWQRAHAELEQETEQRVRALREGDA